jgi:GNAT superfamily N-acetyltransferase
MTDFRFVKAAQDHEWAHYHRINETQIFKPRNLVYNRESPCFINSNHHHFVLYSGSDIVGMTHVECLNPSEIALKCLAIDAQFQHRGFGQIMMAFIEKWCLDQGRNILKMHAALSAEHFYRQLGYVEMPFGEQSIAQDIIDLGKYLK